MQKLKTWLMVSLFFLSAVNWVSAKKGYGSFDGWGGENAEENYCWIFNQEDNFLDWQPNNFSSIGVDENSLKGTTKYDPQLLSPILNLDASYYRIFEFKVKSNVSGDGELYFRHSGEDLTDLRKVTHTIIGDNQFHVYRDDLSSCKEWDDEIAQIRFDILNNEGAEIEIEYLKFLPKDKEISNGSFERWSLDGKIEDWQVNTNGINCLVGEKKVTDGKKSLLLKGKGNITLESKDFEFKKEGSYSLSFSYLPLSIPEKTELNVTILFKDVFDKVIKEEIFSLLLKQLDNFQEFSKEFSLPEKAAGGKIKVKVVFPSTAELYLDNFNISEVKSDEKEVFSKFEPSWLASWIWAPELENKDQAWAYFRKSFFLEDEPEEGNLIITADDICKVYINGKELPEGENFDNWRIPDLYNITPYLKKGENVLAIKAFDNGGQEGLLAECGVHLKNKKSIFIKTDSSFKSKAEPKESWYLLNFDDKDWLPSYEIGKVPIAPWGEIPYTYIGEKEEVEIINFSFPKELFPGETVDFSFSFIPKSKNFHLYLGLSNPNFSTCLIRKELKELKENNENTFNAKIKIPVFISPDTYQISLKSPYYKYTTKKEEFKTIENSIVREVKVNEAEVRKTPNTKVIIKDGEIPVLLINNNPWSVMHYITDFPQGFEGNMIDNCRNVNLHLYWINIGNWGWKISGKHDFSIIDQACSKLLEVDPDAHFVFNFPLDSFNNTEMRSWNQKYPEELVRNEEGSTQINIYGGSKGECPSMASKVWIEEAKNSLREIIRHIRQSPFKERVIGYVPISGITWEWMYWGSQYRDFVDYSKPFQEGFQCWLKEKYGNINNLNSTYKENFKDFKEIPLPSKQEREKDDYWTFLDPQKSQYLIDFRQFFSELVADDILELAKVVKEETNREALCGTYYGYVAYVISPLWNETGHFALGKVLNSKDIDFLMSPSRYSDRGIGGGSGFMTTVDSLKLHNKYYIDQADIRTLHSDESSNGKVYTLRDSVAVLEREFANTLISGAACQWFDFALGWTSKDTRLMEVVGRLRNIEEQMQNISRKTMDKETSIAVIVDEKSTYYTIQTSPLHEVLINDQYPALSRTGTGFDCFLLEDLPLLPEYKCYLFLNTFNITEEQKKFIDENLKKDNKTLVWVFAPGILDGKTINTKRIEEITGIKMKVEEEQVSAITQIINVKDPITSFLFEDYRYGGANLGPLFIPQEGKVLGTLKETGDPSLVVKKFPTWTSIYSFSPSLPAGLLRGIAKYSGVHIANYNDSDITYLSDKLMSVHTLLGGKRTLYVPLNFKGKVKELITGAEFLVKNNSFEVELKPSSTSIFLFE